MCKLPSAGRMCSKLVYLFSFAGFVVVVLKGGNMDVCFKTETGLVSTTEILSAVPVLNHKDTILLYVCVGR